jgi:hypothetical protein
MRTFPTASVNFPPCPQCESRRVRMTLLTFYLVAFFCTNCEATWTETNEELEKDEIVTA